MTPRPMPGADRSLCKDCAHLGVVTNARGSTFWRCKWPANPMKYPPQPVLRCAGHAPAGGDPGLPDEESR